MRDRSAGYALVEMLASLIIIGFASTLMISGLSASRRVWEHIDSANFAGETVAGAQMLLRERLERAFPATRFDKIPAYSDIEGTASSLNFLSSPRDVQAPSVLRRYVLSLASNGDLILASASDLAANPPGESLALLHGAQGFDIAYYGTVPPASAPSWQLQWHRMSFLPKLIRIRVQFPPQDPRVWPDLLIRPVATVDSQCVLVVRTGKCRGRA
jgi:general secretion pathway protein J